MPSIVGHSLTGTAAAYVCRKRFSEIKFNKFLFLSILAANIPDFDIFFHYTRFSELQALMHRNFLHSLLFAFIGALVLGFGFYSVLAIKKRFEISLYFFIVINSHNLLDALTKGFGVAFFYPVDKTQYNFPITPLNPAGWSLAEFSANNALFREALIVWIPMLLTIISTHFMHKKRF